MAEEQAEGFDFVSNLNKVGTEDLQQPAPRPKNNFGDIMNDVADQAFKTNFAPPSHKSFLDKMNAPVESQVGYAGPDLDMYRFQDDFNPYTFNANDPSNYERWTADQSWGDALGKGFDSFGSRFGHTFKDYWKGYGRMVDALFSWDMDKLQPSEADMIEYNWKEHKKMMENFVFIPKDEDDDIFSKRSVSEFLGNAGFALGTFAGVAVELVADLLITVGTGGPGGVSFGVTAAKIFGKEAVEQTVKQVGKKAAKESAEQAAKKGAKKSGKFFTDIMEGWRVGDTSADGIRASATETKVGQTSATASTAKVGNESVRDWMRTAFDDLGGGLDRTIKSKSFGEFAENFAKGIPLVGTGIRYGEKIAAGSKAGMSAGKLTGMGLKGLSRIRQEFNLASTEAAFEGVSTYGDTLDQMVKQYKADHNGETPTAEEFIRMQDLAMQASFKNYGTNLAILLASNKIQFGGLFSKFGVANKFGKELLEDATQDYLKVNRVFKSAGSGLTGKAYKKNFWGTYGLIGQVSKDFGRKQATYELGKKLIKGFGKFEIAEGLQENLQETSNTAWKNYYASQYDNASLTLGDAFGEGLGEQWSKQGLKTFLMGALTGGIIHGPTRLFQKGLAAGQKAAMNAQYKNAESNPYQQHEDAMDARIDLVNNAIAMMSGKVKKEATVLAFSNAAQASIDQTEAAAGNKHYEYQNAKDNMMLNAAIAANRSGSIEMFVHALRDAGIDMTAEQFEAQFGTKLSETKYSSPMEFMNEVADDMKKYSDIVDGVRKSAKNIADPFMYEVGTKERMVASILHNAQEDAIKIIALNKMKAIRADERAEAVSKDLMSIAGLANSSEHALRVLTNPEMFVSEIGTMQSDILLLTEQLKDENLTPELKADIKQQIKDKKEELKIYEEWMSYWENREVITRVSDPKTGEVAEKKEIVKDTYVGRKFKREKIDPKRGGRRKKLRGKAKKQARKESATQEDAWNLHDDTVINTFRKFINLRNKKAGINAEVSEEDLRSGFEKIIDFIRLDQDAKDYMKAVDSLYNPEYYRQVVQRMADGKFKKELLDWTFGIENAINQQVNIYALQAVSKNPEEYLMEGDSIDAKFQVLMQDIYNEFESAVLSSDAYKNIIMITMDETMGTDQYNLAIESIKEIEKSLRDVALRLERKFNPDSFEDISDEEYKKFKADKTVSEQTKDILAQKIFSGEVLSEKQSEVHDFFKEDITKRVQTLKDAVAKKRDQKRTKTKTYDESAEKVTKGRAGTALYILDTDDRNSDDIVQYYGVQDMSNGNLAQVVQKAIQNPQTHPYVKQALKSLLPFINPNHKIEFNSEQTYAPGYYDVGNKMVIMDPTIADLGMSFEGILLHELIHSLTSTELENAPNGEFATTVKDLLDHSRDFLSKTGVDIDFYGFTNVHEFLAEAYSNPEFQAELQKIPSKYGQQSVWQDFLALLSDFLKRAFNINMQQSVLDDVFRVVEDHIGATPAGLAKRRLVQAGQFSTEQVQAMTREEAISNAVNAGLVTTAELEMFNQPKEEISDEDWNNWTTKQEVSDEILKSLAQKNVNKQKLTRRESSIYNTNKDRVDAIEAEFKKETNVEGEYSPGFQEGLGWYVQKGGTPITEANTVDENGEPKVSVFNTKEEAEKYIEQITQKTAEESKEEPVVDDVEPADSEMEDGFIEGVMAGQPANPVEDVKETAAVKPATFNVFGDSEQGFEVRTATDVPVITGIPTLEEAQGLRDQYINNRANIDFAMKFLGSTEGEFNEWSEDLSLFLDRAVVALNDYNKTAENKVDTLEEYNLLPKGRKELQVIKESVEQGLTVAEVETEEADKKERAITEGIQTQLFETTSSETAGQALTLESIQNLNNRLESLKQKEEPQPKKDASLEERKDYLDRVGYLIDEGNDGTFDVVDRTEGYEVISDHRTSLEEAVKAAEEHHAGKKKSAKFTAPAEGVTEDSILNKLKDIHGCTK
jgi:hypothetical protein